MVKTSCNDRANHNAERARTNEFDVYIFSKKCASSKSQITAHHKFANVESDSLKMLIDYITKGHFNGENGQRINTKIKYARYVFSVIGNRGNRLNSNDSES